MNGTLAEMARRKLYPALEKSQGFTGAYARGGTTKSLTAVPTTPDWAAMIGQGTSIDEDIGIEWLVSLTQWASTGFGIPKHNDRFTVTLADGGQRVFALLGIEGKREWENTVDGSGYILRMKEVAA